MACRQGSPIFTCRKTRRNNWGARQTTQPRIPAQEIKPQKPLTKKISGGCIIRRNSQSHRRLCWRDPQGPRMYTNPPTQESAPGGPNLIVGSRGMTESQQRVEHCSLSDPSPTYSVTRQPCGLPHFGEHLRLRPTLNISPVQ